MRPHSRWTVELTGGERCKTVRGMESLASYRSDIGRHKRPFEVEGWLDATGKDEKQRENAVHVRATLHKRSSYVADNICNYDYDGNYGCNYDHSGNDIIGNDVPDRGSGCETSPSSLSRSSMHRMVPSSMVTTPSSSDIFSDIWTTYSIGELRQLDYGDYLRNFRPNQYKLLMKAKESLRECELAKTRIKIMRNQAMRLNNETGCSGRNRFSDKDKLRTEEEHRLERLQGEIYQVYEKKAQARENFVKCHSAIPKYQNSKSAHLSPTDKCAQRQPILDKYAKYQSILEDRAKGDEQYRFVTESDKRFSPFFIGEFGNKLDNHREDLDLPKARNRFLIDHLNVENTLSTAAGAKEAEKIRYRRWFQGVNGGAHPVEIVQAGGKAARSGIPMVNGKPVTVNGKPLPSCNIHQYGSHRYYDDYNVGTESFSSEQKLQKIRRSGNLAGEKNGKTSNLLDVLTEYCDRNTMFNGDSRAELYDQQKEDPINSGNRLKSRALFSRRRFHHYTPAYLKEEQFKEILETGRTKALATVIAQARKLGIRRGYKPAKNIRMSIQKCDGDESGSNSSAISGRKSNGMSKSNHHLGGGESFDNDQHLGEDDLEEESLPGDSQLMPIDHTDPLNQSLTTSDHTTISREIYVCSKGTLSSRGTFTLNSSKTSRHTSKKSSRNASKNSSPKHASKHSSKSATVTVQDEVRVTKIGLKGFPKVSKTDKVEPDGGDGSVSLNDQIADMQSTIAGMQNEVAESNKLEIGTDDNKMHDGHKVIVDEKMHDVHSAEPGVPNSMNHDQDGITDTIITIQGIPSQKSTTSFFESLRQSMGSSKGHREFKGDDSEQAQGGQSHSKSDRLSGNPFQCNLCCNKFDENEMEIHTIDQRSIPRIIVTETSSQLSKISSQISPHRGQSDDEDAHEFISSLSSKSGVGSPVLGSQNENSQQSSQNVHDNSRVHNTHETDAEMANGVRHFVDVEDLSKMGNVAKAVHSIERKVMRNRDEDHQDQINHSFYVPQRPSTWKLVDKNTGVLDSRKAKVEKKALGPRKAPPAERKSAPVERKSNRKSPPKGGRDFSSAKKRHRAQCVSGNEPTWSHIESSGPPSSHLEASMRPSSQPSSHLEASSHLSSPKVDEAGSPMNETVDNFKFYESCSEDSISEDGYSEVHANEMLTTEIEQLEENRSIIARLAQKIEQEELLRTNENETKISDHIYRTQMQCTRLIANGRTLVRMHAQDDVEGSGGSDEEIAGVNRSHSRAGENGLLSYDTESFSEGEAGIPDERPVWNNSFTSKHSIKPPDGDRDSSDDWNDCNDFDENVAVQRITRDSRQHPPVAPSQETSYVEEIQEPLAAKGIFDFGVKNFDFRVGLHFSGHNGVEFSDNGVDLSGNDAIFRFYSGLKSSADTKQTQLESAEAAFTGLPAYQITSHEDSSITTPRAANAAGESSSSSSRPAKATRKTAERESLNVRNPPRETAQWGNVSPSNPTHKTAPRGNVSHFGAGDKGDIVENDPFGKESVEPPSKRAPSLFPAKPSSNVTRSSFKESGFVQTRSAESASTPATRATRQAASAAPSKPNSSVTPAKTTSEKSVHPMVKWKGEKKGMTMRSTAKSSNMAGKLKSMGQMMHARHPTDPNHTGHAMHANPAVHAKQDMPAAHSESASPSCSAGHQLYNPHHAVEGKASSNLHQPNQDKANHQNSQDGQATYNTHRPGTLDSAAASIVFGPLGMEQLEFASYDRAQYNQPTKNGMKSAMTASTSISGKNVEMARNPTTSTSLGNSTLTSNNPLISGNRGEGLLYITGTVKQPPRGSTQNSIPNTSTVGLPHAMRHALRDAAQNQSVIDVGTASGVIQRLRQKHVNYSQGSAERSSSVKSSESPTGSFPTLSKSPRTKMATQSPDFFGTYSSPAERLEISTRSGDQAIKSILKAGQVEEANKKFEETAKGLKTKDNSLFTGAAGFKTMGRAERLTADNSRNKLLFYAGPADNSGNNKLTAEKEKIGSGAVSILSNLLEGKPSFMQIERKDREVRTLGATAQSLNMDPAIFGLQKVKGKGESENSSSAARAQSAEPRDGFSSQKRLRAERSNSLPRAILQNSSQLHPMEQEAIAKEQPIPTLNSTKAKRLAAAHHLLLDSLRAEDNLTSYDDFLKHRTFVTGQNRTQKFTTSFGTNVSDHSDSQKNNVSNMNNLNDFSKIPNLSNPEMVVDTNNPRLPDYVVSYDRFEFEEYRELCMRTQELKNLNPTNLKWIPAKNRYYVLGLKLENNSVYDGFMRSPTVRDGYGELKILHPTTKEVVIRYCGNWVCNMVDGQGILETTESRYEGTFRSGFKNGKGIEYWLDKQNGCSNEKGEERPADLIANDLHNFGIHLQDTYYRIPPDSQLVKNHSESVWNFCPKNDCRGCEGFGQYKKPTKKTLNNSPAVSKYAIKYEGEYFEGKKHGYGCLVYYTQEFTYIGSFEDDYIQGEGTLVYKGLPKGLNYSYTGKFLKNMKHGKGIIRYGNGTFLCGNFQNDEFIGDQEIQPQVGALGYYSGENGVSSIPTDQYVSPDCAKGVECVVEKKKKEKKDKEKIRK